MIKLEQLLLSMPCNIPDCVENALVKRKFTDYEQPVEATDSFAAIGGGH